MTTTVLRPRDRAVADRVTLARTIHAEWTKLRSLRSTGWALLIAVTLIIGVGVLLCMARAANWPPRNPADVPRFDPTAVSLTGIYLAQLAIGVLAALVITGEYATGAIRTTFLAAPRRLPALCAKAVVYAGVTFAVCLPATLVAFGAGQVVFASRHIDANLADPGVLRAILGGALYLTAAGLLGLGLGALTRNTAAAVSTLVGLLFLAPIVAGFLPEPTADTVTRYLPMPAGTQITNIRPDPSMLGPWTGLGLFALYAATALGIAAWRLRRGDA